MNRSRVGAMRTGWLIATAASTALIAGSSASAATITVTSTAQEPGGAANGNCTLGEAVRAANGDIAVDACAAGSGDDVIVIPAGTFVIDVADGATMYGGPTAVPRLTSSVTIQGAGSTTTIIRPATSAPVFGFTSADAGGGRVVLNGLALQGFRTVAVLATAPLATDDVVFRDNFTGDSGGAAVRCLNCGSLTFRNSTFANNTANTERGGAVYALGPAVTIDRCTFTGNHQSNGGGALGLECPSATITDSTFTGNVAGFVGGAISARTPGDSGGLLLTITRSTFTDNSAPNDPGMGGPGGGALALVGGRGSTLTDCTFDNNRSVVGGAISLGTPGEGATEADHLTVDHCTFRNNASARIGAAINNIAGTVTVTASTFEANRAEQRGGAIHHNGASLVMTDSAFLANSAGIPSVSIAASDADANESGDTGTFTITRDATPGNAIYISAPGSTSVTGSCIVGHAPNAVQNDTGATANLTGNWWGSASGPGTSTMPAGDVVAGPADTSGFLGTATARCPTAPTPSVLVVGYSVTGSATAGVDYATLSGSVTFSGAQTTATVTVAPIADGIADDGETVIATLDPATPLTYDVGSMNTATVTIANAEPTTADLSVTKTVSVDHANVGDEVTYTITVTNAGPAVATSVTATDTLPAGLVPTGATGPSGVTCSATNPVTCTLGDIAAGASIVVTVRARITMEGVIANTVVVGSSVNDPNDVNQSSTATLTATAVPMDGGLPDAGADAGDATIDAGSTDAGPVDAGDVPTPDVTRDASALGDVAADGDAGTGGRTPGCGCRTPGRGRAGHSSIVWTAIAIGILFASRRSRRS